MYIDDYHIDLARKPPINNDELDPALMPGKLKQLKL